MSSPSDRIGDDRLREILAGCEGVTPGPYVVGAFGDLWAGTAINVDGKWDAIPGREPRILPGLLTDPVSRAEREHFSRLDPQTVASIVAELLELRQQRNRIHEMAASARDRRASRGILPSPDLQELVEASAPLSRPTKEPAHGK